MVFTNQYDISEDSSSVDAVRDVLAHMWILESTSYQKPINMPEPFSGLWRQQIVEWMYILVKFCELRHESVAAASYFLDVSTSKGLIQTGSDYQLGAMTALYLALKVYDSPSMRVVKLSSLVKLGNGDFGVDDVIEMERRMCLALEWRMNPPTPNCFLQQYLLLLPKDVLAETRDKLEELSMNAIEICVAKHYFVSMKPSVLAYAAMLIALQQMDQSYMSLSQLRQFMHNMANVAQLDNDSNMGLNHAAQLIDQAMRSFPMPEEQKRSPVEDSGLLHQSIHCQRTSYGNHSFSSYFAMQ